jgi:hypothetical protein
MIAWFPLPPGCLPLFPSDQKLNLTRARSGNALSKWPFVIPGRPGKGDRSILPERPEGCFAQNGPVPFSRALAGYRNKADRRPEITKGHLACFTLGLLWGECSPSLKRSRSWSLRLQRIPDPPRRGLQRVLSPRVPAYTFHRLVPPPRNLRSWLDGKLHASLADPSQSL